MTSTESIEIEGLTMFPASPSYRYIIELKDDKLTLWMENQTDKGQWFSGGFSKTDLVSPMSALPCGSAADYVKCLQQALDIELSESSDVTRALTQAEDDSIRLTVTMKFRLLCSTWTMENVFDLKPGTIARINALETTVREQRELLKELQDCEGVTATELKAARKDASSNVYWTKLDSKDCIVSEDTHRVVICRTGVYVLVGGTKIAPESYHDTVRVMKNGVRVEVSDFERQGRKGFVAIMHVSAGDNVTVQCDCKVDDLIDLELVSLNQSD